MKISIVGTRGIPNNYGGFEQFAQYLSLELIKNSNEVTVYNPSYRKEKEANWKGVFVKKKFCPSFFNSFSQVIYDYLSIKDAIKENADIILVCGYVSSYLALVRFFKYKDKIVVHMDGWEWKRRKWNIITRQIIKYIEKSVVKKMPYLVVDHPILKEYYQHKYKKRVFEIAYGCHVVEVVAQTTPQNEPFFLMIARNEKENNIDLVCRTFLKSGVKAFLYIFSNKKYKYKNDKIVWIQNEYNENVLNFYRSKARAYIHAYTVGGTNPSLLESMAYCKTIIAYDNDFHQTILEENAIYFKSKTDLIHIFKSLIDDNSLHLHLEPNRNKIIKNYQWSIITKKYESLFKTIMNV